MEKLNLSKTNLKTAGEGGCIPLILPPRSAPGHKLQKPSKESGIFQSLDTICSFLRKGKVKRREPWHNAP